MYARYVIPPEIKSVGLIRYTYPRLYWLHSRQPIIRNLISIWESSPQYEVLSQEYSGNATETLPDRKSES